MLKSLFAASIAVLSLASAASAQVIYEPVKYQYSMGDTYLYYGGSNPRVFQEAWSHYQLNNQPRSYDWHGHERTTIRKGLTGRAPYVYTDAAPYVNASLYGYTDLDARNEAYSNVPTYFRKRDILAAGVVQADGSLLVRADARPAVPVRVVRRVIVPATQPLPKAIIIIPKRPLAPQKAGAASDKSLTLAE
jgi:hypothetical protein